MLCSRKVWSFTILLYWDFEKVGDRLKYKIPNLELMRTLNSFHQFMIYDERSYKSFLQYD